MAIVPTLFLFLGSLALTLLASAVLSHRIDQVGSRFGLSEGLLGLVTALGANSPEIAAAVTALVGGQNDLGRGVIFGSNIFNLASLLGLSAIATGGFAAGRSSLLLNAGVALWVTGCIVVEFLFGLPPALVGVCIFAVFAPYVLINSLKPHQLRWLRAPAPAVQWLRLAAGAAEVDTGEDRRPAAPSWADMAAIPPLLAIVVVSSIGLVRTASGLGERFGLSAVTIGAVVLASLTGVPNVVAALRLAKQGRGSAVVSEAFNSNSLNLIIGAYIPTLFLAYVSPSPMTRLSLFWLAGGTVLAAGLLLFRGGLRRAGGLLLILMYAVFVLIIVTR